MTKERIKALIELNDLDGLSKEFTKITDNVVKESNRAKALEKTLLWTRARVLIPICILLSLTSVCIGKKVFPIKITNVTTQEVTQEVVSPAPSPLDDKVAIIDSAIKQEEDIISGDCQVQTAWGEQPSAACVAGPNATINTLQQEKLDLLNGK
jgi:hypothetical protein